VRQQNRQHTIFHTPKAQAAAFFRFFSKLSRAWRAFSPTSLVLFCCVLTCRATCFSLSLSLSYRTTNQHHNTTAPNLATTTFTLTRLVPSRACTQGWVVGAYLVGDAAAEEVVCVAADAAGWRAPGVRRFARRLAARGALVVTPDLWRGDTWYGDPSPSARESNPDFDAWAAGHPVEKIASDMAAVMTALRECGAKRVSVVGMGLGAGAVVSLLAKDAAADEACTAGAVVCPLGVAAAAAASAAAASAPVVFVWGGGDAVAAAAAEAEAAMEAAAGEAAAGKWASRVFASQDAHFAFWPDGEGEDGCADEEEAAAALVLEWTSVEV
jgi:dienelactone hydrolase